MLDNFVTNLTPEFTRDGLIKYIRLVVLIACYVLARRYFTNWSKTRQVAQQVARDKQEKQDRLDGKIQDAEEPIKGSVNPELTSSFGWGKKTASLQKQKQKVVNDLVEQVRQETQSQYDAAEDHDIDYLLED